MAKKMSTMSPNACVDTKDTLAFKWCQSVGHTVSHVERENRHVTFDGEQDVLVKTMGGGVVLKNRDGSLKKQATMYFNKASNDVLSAFRGMRFSVGTVHIPYRGTYAALIEDPKGCKLRFDANNAIRGQYRINLRKNLEILTECLDNGRHIRSPKFSAWLLDEEHNGGLTTIVLVPAERMCI